jgi:biopolymer transport protein ExbD
MRLFSLLFLLIIMSVAVNAKLDFDLTKQDSGIVSGLEGENLTLSVDGRNEIDMIVTRVGSERIMASLNDNSQTLVLDLTQEKQIDLNKDGELDVKITLNNVIDKLASFKIEKIETLDENIVVDDSVDEFESVVEVMDSEESIDKVTAAENIDLGNLGEYTNLAIGVIVIVVIVVLIYVFKGGNDSEKIYNKATDLHREGQEFHWDGDDETAEELYDKADELREKARSAEGGF